MALVQYKSETVNGLMIVIDHTTGNVYATQSALARLIDKHSQYIYRHEKALIEGGTKVDRLEAEVVTPGGLQGSTLYGEDFIYSLLAKYKPDLLVQAAKAGIRLYFYNVAGYVPTMTQDPDPNQKYLGAWKEARQLCKFTHLDFQNACLAKGHSAKAVHDLITKTLTGYTASKARTELTLMDSESNPTIGLNYQPDAYDLALIAKAKRLYAGYRKGDWRDQCLRACFHASPD
jgi:hypothetical protein